MDERERLKEEKKIQKKRNGRTSTVVGWIVLIAGAMDLISSTEYFRISFMSGIQACFLPLVMVCLGAWLISHTRKNVAKWNQYDALINQNGNTSLRMIAKKTGKSVDQVRDDIQKMINNGFFRDEDGNIGAYIHGEYDILVMMEDGLPKEPLEKTVKEQKEAMAAEAAEEEKEAKADKYADAIGQAAAQASDPDVADSLRSIENSVRRINRKVERRPELKDSDNIRQLQEIYLPKTMELIEKLTTQDASPATMLEIKGILNTCAIAYKNIVDKVSKRDDEDTLIDIELLQQTFEREGLLGSDFDIK